MPALDGGVELQGAAGGLDSGGAEGAAEEAAVPTNIETFFGPGWTAESVHAQVLQLVEGLRVAENTSKYHLQTMLEAEAKAEAAAAELVASEADKAELLARLEVGPPSAAEELASSRRKLLSMTTALPEEGMKQIRESLGPNVLTAVQHHVMEQLVIQPGQKGPREKLRLGLIEVLTAGGEGRAKEFFPAKVMTESTAARAKSTILAQCGGVIKSLQQLHSNGGEKYIVKTIAEVMRKASVPHLETVFRSGSTILEVMRAYNAAKAEEAEERGRNQYTDALVCLRNIASLDQDLLCDVAVALAGKLSKTVVAHSRRTAGGDDHTTADLAERGWVLLMLLVKELVVDQPTHMVEGLRRILDMQTSLKGRFHTNFSWYVTAVIHEVVAFEEKNGVISSELLVHALLLPHMIEGTDQSLELWRKDLQYHKKLGEMIYSSYLELKPNIPKLVKELTEFQATASPEVFKGAPVPLMEYLAAVKGHATERVHFATRDDAPTCVSCGHRHYGANCLKETNVKRALEEIGPCIQVLKMAGKDLARANKATGSADQKRGIEALATRIDGSVARLEKAAGGGGKPRGPIGQRAKVLVVEEKVLAVETKKPPMYIGTFKDRLADRKLDPKTCFGHAVYGKCTRDGCAFVHDRATKGIFPVGGRPSGGGADGVKTRAATKAAVGKTGAAPKQTTTRTVPGSKCAATGCDKPR